MVRRRSSQGKDVTFASVDESDDYSKFTHLLCSVVWF